MRKNLEQELESPVIYTKEQAFKESFDYFNGDELAANSWVNKYSLKDSAGNIYESNPNQMHERIASEIARVESKYENPMSKEKIFDLIKDFKYIVPQGSPMAGIGNNYQTVSLSNCFVIGNEGVGDSYGGIMKIDQEQVQLMKRRGGVGHDLSHIRPSGSTVKNSALTSTGIVPFMERYSNSTREVAQDGRRGALMLSVSVKHPDSEDFIDAKMEQGKITGANVSVKLHDDFMQAVENGEMYQQQYPIDSDSPTHTKEIDAKGLWGKIVHNAWKSAEPGVLFWDTIEKESIPDCYADLGYKTVSTNPCGEIPLCPDDSCRLLAINLYSYVDKPFTKEATFNEELFREHVGYAQRMMDDIIDLELEKIDGILKKIDSDPESDEVKRVERNLWTRIQKKAEEGRRTGVGITAEGDMLAALGYTYGSDEAIEFSTNVHKNLALAAYESSVEMAEERGAFKVYDAEREKDNPMIQRIKEADPELYKRMEKSGRRNIAALTIAPTGTTSLMTQTTSGIEPVFLPAYKRRKKINPTDKDAKVDFVDEVGDKWQEFQVFHHKFVDWMVANDINPAQEFSEEELNDIVKKSPYHKATSNDIDWVQKVKMQGAIQKWVDHSISVTVNLPNDVTEETVNNVYMEAWKAGCKGVTVYRDGSRSGVLLSGKEKNESITPFPDKRPKSLEAEVLRFKNYNQETKVNEDWLAFVGMIEKRPYEIFTGKADQDFLPVPSHVEKGEIVKKKNGKTHYDFEYKTGHGFTNTIAGISYEFDPEFWNYAKLISGTLRQGMPVDKVVNLVHGLKTDNESINTWMAGVERALKKYIPDGTEYTGKEICQDCSSEDLEYSEGCLKCRGCGSSKCG